MERRAWRKAVVLGLLACMAFGSLGGVADAKKKRKKPKRVERTAQGTYAAPATLVGSCTQTDGIGCMTIPSGVGELYLTAKVTDTLGQPVSISVEADLDGDNTTETVYGTFCGETSEPIAIDEGTELVFWVGRADVAVLDGCVPGIATQGTLEVTFSNMP